jgi:hypothetical protein
MPAFKWVRISGSPGFARRGRSYTVPTNHPPEGRRVFEASIIEDVSNAIGNVFRWFQTLTPGGFGLILIPLIILGTITILVSRNR